MNNFSEKQIESLIKKVFVKLAPYCRAIYKGGSKVDPVINNPHDYDYISFSEPTMKTFLFRKLRESNLRIGTSKRKKIFQEDLNTLPKEDFSQIRAYPYTQITWFSYLDKLMIKVVGEDICPQTDIITEYREEFIAELKQKALLLQTKKILNQKRWYHILRGVYILLNNSYEVTEEQKQEINILHDLSEGWETIKDKTIYLLNSLK